MLVVISAMQDLPQRGRVEGGQVPSAQRIGAQMLVRCGTAPRESQKMSSGSVPKMHRDEELGSGSKDPPSSSPPNNEHLAATGKQFSRNTGIGSPAIGEGKIEREARYSQRSKVAFACFLHLFCGISMVLTNKSLASSYNHLIDGDLNILMVVFQAFVAVICVEFSRISGWVEYPRFDMQTAGLWAPVNVIFCAMLFTGMASLQHNNVPMVTVFKNTTNIFITAGDRFFFGARIEILVLAAFAVMLGGACMAAVNDVQITFIGMSWMLANCLATAGYVLYMKFATDTVKMSKFGMVFYNNVLCILFLLPTSVVRGDIRRFWSTPGIHTWTFFSTNLFSGFIGFFLNFSSLNCVAVTGPTTYAIIGTLKQIPISILGALIFSSKITSKTWFFIVVNLLGGFIYSYAKMRNRHAHAN